MWIYSHDAKEQFRQKKKRAEQDRVSRRVGLAAKPFLPTEANKVTQLTRKQNET